MTGDALKDRDADVRVIVLTGAGRGICSGLDLEHAAAASGIGGSSVLSAGGSVAHISLREIPTVTLDRIDTPVICAQNGPAAGSAAGSRRQRRRCVLRERGGRGGVHERGQNDAPREPGVASAGRLRRRRAPTPPHLGVF